MNMRLKVSTMKRAIPILALALILPHVAFPATIRVPSEQQYISGAINAAENGDTILVAPGTYIELGGIVIFRKAVHVRSENGPAATIIQGVPMTVDEGCYAFAIRSTPGPCTIEGFTMSHHRSGSLGSDDFTIHVDSATVRIVNNRFVSNDYSYVIEIWNSPSAEIEHNLFLDNTATAIHVYRATDVTIRSNTFSNPDNWQIYARTINGHLTISNNIIVEGSRGIVTSCPAENITCTCNDLWNNDINYDGTLADQTGTNGNISADPLFCGIPHSGNLYLQAASPCAAANTPAACGGSGMGVYPAKCTVAAGRSTWSGLKKIYR